jgi:hypothetical protein
MGRHIESQQASPRYDDANGVDYGRDGKILAVRGSLLLVWHPGGTFWSGWSGNCYSPAGMEVRGLPGQRTGKEISSGGRLSAALVARNAAAIDEYFGDGVAAAIKIKNTLVIDAPEDQQG